MLALNARVGDIGEREVRQCVGEDGGPEAGNVGVIEEQINERRGEKDEARHRVKKMAHGVEVAEPLGEFEAGRKERIFGAHDLDHAARPADALADVRGEALSGEAGSLRNVDVGRVPAGHLHAQRGVRVFGDGFVGDAADFVESGAAQDRAGAAEEGGVPEIVAVLDHAVEQLALIGNDVKLPEIALEWIGRIEMMRRLHHGQFGVAQKPADGHLQKAARGDVIGIEDGHERRGDGFERGVDVAGLGVTGCRGGSCNRCRPRRRTARIPCGGRRRGYRREVCRRANPC